MDVEAHALVTRACLYEVKCDKPRYEKDVEEAYRLSPTHPPAVANFAMLLHSRGETDGAIAALRKAVGLSSSEEGVFLLNSLLRDRGSTGDMKEALSYLCHLAKPET